MSRPKEWTGNTAGSLENFYANLQIREKRYLSYRMIWNFCAEYADRVGMMFDGKIEGIDEPSKFFAQNYFYTTECAKITRDFEKVIILPQRW